MTINYLAIILLTIVSFVGGSVWFSNFMFGKTWMRIHGMDKKSPEELDMMKKNSTAFMTTEFVLTLVFNYILYLIVIETNSLASALQTASLLWVGFVLPITISNVIWSSAGSRWVVKKVVLSSVYRLIMMLLAAWIFFVW